jgi:hypothetical protein
MIWHKHKNLSDNDLRLLAGTPLIEKMLTNRLVVVFDSNTTIPSLESLGLFNTIGLVHVKYLQQNQNHMEFLFECPEDLTSLENYLTLLKLKS